MSELSEKVGDLLAQQNWDSAFDEIEAARNADPFSAEGWVLQSQLALELKNIDDALGAVEHALRIAPNFAPAMYQMAYVLRAQNQVPDALTWYARAFSIHPVLADSLGWCHVMVLSFGEYVMAMPIAEYWTVQRSSDAAGWFLFGTCCLAMRQSATVSLNRAWELDSSILDLPNNLGGAYLLDGDLVQAEHWLQVALDRQPDDENTQSNIALLKKLQSAI